MMQFAGAVLQGTRRLAAGDLGFLELGGE